MSNGNGDGGWTEDDVQRVLFNPIHTMGSHPTIEDDAWISAQEKLLSELGPSEYFHRLLIVLQETFGPAVE